MTLDPRVSRNAVTEDEHVRVPVLPPDDVREYRPRPVTQHRLRPAGLDRGQIATFKSHVRVTDRIDTTVERVQATVGDAYGDRIVGEPASNEVRERDHAVLTSGDLREVHVASGWLFRLSLKY